MEVSCQSERELSLYPPMNSTPVLTDSVQTELEGTLYNSTVSSRQDGQEIIHNFKNTLYSKTATHAVFSNIPYFNFQENKNNALSCVWCYILAQFLVKMSKYPCFHQILFML